jgi:hypothetical protein
MLLLSPYLPTCNIVGQGETGTILPVSDSAGFKNKLMGVMVYF